MGYTTYQLVQDFFHPTDFFGLFSASPLIIQYSYGKLTIEFDDLLFK
jgi:hypothetical protein